ncbi:MAG: ABC-F type ribosomal protection protein [Eubacteriales bacterium]|nr:ABC-F type ribosomal protection protein [Eubacteriales bacterium]
MISISVDNISLSFGVETILDGISFALNEGDKMGIVGVNGAGKSSLFRVISGEYSQDSGSVYISKDKSVGILEQNTEFTDDNTLIDEMLLTYKHLLDAEDELKALNAEIESGEISLGARYATAHDAFVRNGGYEFRGRCRGMLISLGFAEEFHSLKISSLSGGQKTRVALARILLREPDILLLDEPTNHLDMNTLFWLEEFLKNYRKTLLVISHDRYFLDRVANKILEIENKRCKLYNGNYSAFVRLKENDRVIQEKHYKIQQREIARIEAHIEQQRRWGRERNIIAAESREKQLAKMERVAKPETPPDKIRMRFNKSGESGNEVLRLNHITKGYPQKPLFNDFSALITKHEHVFITGNNGCGKSTLLKIIAGKINADEGLVEYGYNVKTGYYDQENQELDDENTVIDELWNDYDKLTHTEIRNALALFLFRGDDITKKVEVLSGGEKARLTLAKLILSSMNLLILDEPTNNLDINSREALERALENFDGTIIAVSHDRYFINRLATRILAFNEVECGTIFDYRGGYEEFLEYKNNYMTVENKQNTQTESEAKRNYIENKRTQSEQRRFERKVQKTRDEIAEIEKELDCIAAEMHGEAAADHIRLSELYNREEELESRLLVLYDDWDRMSEFLD